MVPAILNCRSEGGTRGAFLGARASRPRFDSRESIEGGTLIAPGEDALAPGRAASGKLKQAVFYLAE